RPDTQLRLFGKPEVSGKRRLGVAMARAHSVDAARVQAQAVIDDIEITF
ncbi:MAG: phosphoribosylglycinamide formyltransferase 2, partial [Oleibacter sp.]|nr:phosphoribosylglycinamide formyltransferase 2 [Thalassolituus sp.]